MEGKAKSSVNDREKKHVSGALKFLVGEEQRAQALKTAEKWKQRFAEEPKWKEVVSGIKRFANEDHLRDPTYRRPEPQPEPEPEPEPATLHRRTLSTLSTKGNKWLENRSVIPRMRPPTLLRIETAPASSARARASSRPKTPLTATPTHNAFGSGGFWESLTPKSPPDTVSIPVTPLTAIRPEPWSPSIPSCPEAKAAYELIKNDASSTALRLCAGRLSLNSTSSNEKDGLHPSMVSAKDELHGAQLTLASRQLCLKKTIVRDLPDVLATLSTDQTSALHAYTVHTKKDLLDINTWLAIDEKTLELSTIVDTALEIFRINRDRRKASELAVSDQALQLAWAARVLQDVEYAVKAREEDESDESDGDGDAGYDYSNFLRSLRGRSGESADCVDEWGALRHNGTTTTTTTSTTASDGAYSREASLSLSLSHERAIRSPSSILDLRNSTSTQDRISLYQNTSREDTSNDLPLRSRGLSLATDPDRSFLLRRMTSTPAKLTQMLTETHLTIAVPTDRTTSVPTRPLDSPFAPTPAPRARSPTPPRRSDKTSGRVLHSRVPSIHIPPTQNPITAPGLSPEERGSRRQGPSFTMLKGWAEKLRRLKEDSDDNHDDEKEEDCKTTDDEESVLWQDFSSHPLHDANPITLTPDRVYEQHSRSSSSHRSISVPPAEEIDWSNELRRMESRELMRQQEEREIFMRTGRRRDRQSAGKAVERRSTSKSG